MRARKVTLLLLCCVFLSAKFAWAHRIDEYLQATILTLSSSRVDASMRLIPGVLVASPMIDAIDSNHDGVFSAEEKRAYAAHILSDLTIAVDGQPATLQLDAWDVPEPSQLRDGLGEIHLQYHFALPRTASLERRLTVTNGHMAARSVYLVNVEVPQDPAMQIVAQHRNRRQSIYELVFDQGTASSAGSFAVARSMWQRAEMASLFRLGMRHIAEGTDHLLFLLVLLLPAPLLATGSRWARRASVSQSLRHILGIVTAFTLGHSLTLTLAAMNFVHAPTRPVEVLIAASILLSAIHALRPIFPGREAWIAASFGLIHGLAFASTLERLGLSRWDRFAGILAFNLGIETMQLAVVAMVLPSLLLLSRTRAYFAFRSAGAIFAAVTSMLWIVERLFDRQTSVDAVVGVFARNGVPITIGMFLFSVFCFLTRGRQHLKVGDPSV